MTFFTNVFDDKTSCINGLLCVDISDHIPIFHIHKLNNENFKENKKVKHIRKNDEHSMESFISNLDCTDWRKCKNNEDPNIYYNNFIKKFTNIHNNCFPFKKIKLKSKSIKPLVTKGILKSIKRKNLLYKSYIKSPILKTKRNLLHIEINHFLRLSKKHYIAKKIKESKNNMKETWKIINSLLNKSKGKNNYPTHFLDNNTKDTDYNIIASFADIFRT